MGGVKDVPPPPPWIGSAEEVPGYQRRVKVVPPPPPWLGSAEEVPGYQRRRFIHRHYRLEPPRLCHFYRCHNELGNMWTHVAALGFTLMRFASWWVQVPSHSDLVWPGPLYAFGVAAFFVSSLFVFSVSIQYHWRYCSGEREFNGWLCLDLAGCFMTLFIGFAAGIPMGFHCFPHLQKVYLTQAGVICAAMLAALVLERKRGEKVITVLGWGGISAVVPAIHFLAISEVGRNRIGLRLLLVVLCGVVAFLIYTKLWPECYAPGSFDLWGHSHQLWHIFIFLAIAQYNEALIDIFNLTASAEFCLG
ncbi:unnamed protein product [Polarella glacialis]|uniref:Uncharacterized protein n=1 Tax=Polarella glacialis TaxID=89957 RepID=A0A813JRU5_POLGL|nr:unnamed protein product [Polarella glacialis]CAE8683539.1 unnamed protein product [Polarella glacialis]